MKFVFFVAALALFSLAFSQEEDSANQQRCQSLYNDWKRKVDGLYTEKCLNRTETILPVPQVNCESTICINHITSLVAEFQDNFEEMCKMYEFEPEQKDMAESSKLVSSLRKLPCNLCVVKFSEFSLVEKNANDYNCLPSKTEGYGCAEKCLDIKLELIKRWSKMIETECHEHMPGGCGEGDGLNEGQIYDKVKDMTNNIDRIRSSIAFCNKCGATLGPWYGQWTRLGAEGCISSEQIDLSKESPVLEVFEMKAKCSCKDEISQVIHESYLIDPECRQGLISTHMSQLINSVNEKSCPSTTSDDDYGTWSFLGSKSAKGFFTLSIVAVGVIATYFLVKCAKRRSNKSEGYQTVWKQGLPKYEMRARGDDEKGLIYDDDEEEERL